MCPRLLYCKLRRIYDIAADISRAGDYLNGNCHFVFGAALGTAIAVNVDSISAVLPNVTATPETATLFVLGGFLGGIFPDIDNPTSYMGKLSSPVSRWIGKVSAAFGKEGAHHRGIFHDGAIYILGLILSYLFFPPLIGFFIGCLSHIFLDMFNPSGVPFLLGVKHFHLGKIESGSKASALFTWLNVGLVAVAGTILKFM